MTRNHILSIAALALATVALAACGSDSSSSSTAADTDATSTASTESSTAAASGSGGTVKIEADPNGDLAFTETKIDAPAGQDTIEFDNPSTVGHNVEIEDSSGEAVAETVRRDLDLSGYFTLLTDNVSDGGGVEPGSFSFPAVIPWLRAQSAAWVRSVTPISV